MYIVLKTYFRSIQILPPGLKVVGSLEYPYFVLHMEANNCINCNSDLSGAYCATCGQKNGISRITTKSLFTNYLSRIFGFDTKFLRTVRDLTLSPGKVGRTFIEGNRVKYIDPVGYFFIISTLMLLTFAFLNVDITEFMFTNSNQIAELGGQEAPTLRQQEFQQKAFQVLSDNMRVLGFLIIPFIALTAKLFYRKSELNFLEHTTHAFYVQGHTTILTILAIILFKVTAINLNIYIIFVFVPYFAWAAKRFYEKKGFWQWLKGVIFYFVSNIFFVMAFMGVGIAVFFVYVKFINPEFLG